MFRFSEEDLSCPVCCDIFREPVVLPCSHSFCKECVKTYWGVQDSRICPVCRVQAPESEPLVNLILKNLCQSAIEERDLMESTEPELIGLCSQHNREISLVCLEDCKLVCHVCHTYGEHRGHECCSIQEVELELKEKLKGALDNLHKKLMKFQEAKHSCDTTILHIQSQAKSVILHIKKEFRSIRDFLYEEEEGRISAVRKEEQMKKGIMEQKAEEISREIESLVCKIRETEAEMESDKLSFLENYEATMKRAEYSLPDSELLPGALIDVAGHLGNLKFRVWEKMQSLVDFTPVILDPNTANSWLALSEDLTCMWVRDEQQLLPDNPERNESYQCVLGSAGFSAGTHSWDVMVGDSTLWALGVTYNTATRKGKPDLSPEGGLWTIALYDGVYTAQTTPSTPLAIEGQPKEIRVHLNWEEGEVTFTDLTDNAHLYTFKHTFTERVFPYFAHGCISGPLYLQPSEVSVVVESHEQCEDAI
ncbi:E3 ubiquitin-protein ligase TRIM35-like [Conger conger]|uniref:E3 ubiquitin-protein ligase TRIM35-like n=1 Tax=Conger conger TaxID=82655 RepID=UPI002A5AC9CD|nr:E3 ubiquitin-protein ligase TRIM35-like [Conger conger]